MESNEFFMLGYSEPNETIIKNKINKFHKKIEIFFKFKLENDPINSAAILDIDFYSNGNKFLRAKHLGDGWIRRTLSFGSITKFDNQIIFNYIDFGHGNSKPNNLIPVDNLWHKVHVIIKRDNMKCTNKICEFSDCSHEEALSIKDEEINWNEENTKIHKKIIIKIDDLDSKEFNYFTSNEITQISFGNNNLNKNISNLEKNEVYKKHYNREKTFCIKDIEIFVEKEKINLQKEFVSPVIDELSLDQEKCFYCSNKSKYLDTVESRGNFFISGLCEDHFSKYEPSA